MSGHTLLNILSGFVIKIIGVGGLLIALAPFGIVMAVVLLEIAIAFLQAYVFLVLICIYLKDSFEVSH
jgi:F0F1-type ATP synthase membrane subunit a